MADDAGWFIARDGKQQGPVNYAVLLKSARSGRVLPTDLVWKEGMLEWMPAERIGGLFERPTAPPPLPPQPVAYAAPTPRAASDIGNDAGMRMLLPVGRSGWAIAAGYLGLFSVLLIFAPFALLTGILAVRDIRKNPNRHGMGRAVFGIIMGALFSLLLAFAIVMVIFDG